MKKTLHVDEHLLRDAKAASGAKTGTTPSGSAWRLWCAAPHTSACEPCAVRSQACRTRRGAVSAPSRQASGGMSVLVDTSVWIGFLSNRVPFAAQLERLLADDAVAGHELVYGELLPGVRGGREKLLSNYERMDQVPAVPHSDVVAFVRARQLHGRGIGWIDAHLLASALVGRVQLSTTDGPLGAIADELGIAYRVKDSGSA
jgi:predicted nucleic acid-binding protein